MKITVPDEIAEWLQRRAEQEGRTPEEVAKSILEDWLLRREPAKKLDGAARRGPEEADS